MTETQAKSGAAGASTDADDPSVGTPTTNDKESENRASSSGSEKPTGTGGPEPATSPTNPSTTPVVKSQTPVPPVVIGGVAPAAKAEGAKVDGARPTEKADSAARDSSSVPVAAVPEASASAAAADAKTRARPVTGTAPVVSSGGVASPVIARAAVTGPTAPVTTVTGTGLRQTSGATSFVGTVATPTRPTPAGQPATRPTEVRPGRTPGQASRGPRRARLHLKRIDPWSVMKFSFAVSLVLFVVAIVATSVLYLALDAMQVWDSLNSALSDVTGQAGTASDSFRITAKGVIGTAVLLGAVNMVLFTALMTLGAFVYNVCADLVGGIELTLSEKE